MHILKNRIILSFAVILWATYFWEFYVKPITGPLYTAAVAEYKNQNYERSLELLKQAYRIDPNDTAILTLFGWDYLKSGKASDGRPYFARAVRLNPGLEDARLGLAHCWLEMEDGRRALEYFDQLSPKDRQSREVRSAMARAYRMLGDNRTALDIAAGVLREDKRNKLATKELAYLTGSEDLETLAALQSGPSSRPASLVVAARLENGYFHVLRDEVWKKTYIAGVDIGPATPGRFASEPPNELSVYLEWLNQIAGMGANCVRLYTLLPPAFYRALLTYNIRNSRTPMYLFQEIWLKDPPDDNLIQAEFTEDFEHDIRDVVDVIHGHANLPILKGRPGGIFSADVSSYVLGWLVGREVEPRVVFTTNLRNPNVKSFTGKYLKIVDGNASEVWFAQRCEMVIDYEVEKYNWQRPVGFVNWPPLDPLTHPSESRVIDEYRMRQARGEVLPPMKAVVHDDNDVVSLDEERIEALPNFQAGYFASYHIYPFYPDFILHDPNYRAAKDKEGINSYWGYLSDLKSHYRKTPLLVTEYGLSTSIGIAHFNPNGWNHGGLDEVQQGEALVRLTHNIQDVGFAGGIIFEWIDEWWKHNWIADDFEKPFFRKALWHNDMDPEQFFGILKFAPDPPVTYTPLGPMKSGTGQSGPTGPLSIRSIQTAADPSALYLDLELNVPPGTEPNWAEHRYLLALNTCDARCGSSILPFVKDVRALFGANFVIHLSGPENSRIFLAQNYDPYRETPVPGLPMVTDLLIPPNLRTTFELGGRFVEFIVQTNRRRIGKDGTTFPSERYSRSLLRYGVFDSAAKDYNALSQWYYDKGSSRIRLRLSWGLLLVLDPSQGLVYSGTDSKGLTVGKIVRQIQLAVVTYSAQGPATGWTPAQIVGRSVSGGNILEGLSMPWPTWSAVHTKDVLKQSYTTVAKTFSQLTGYPAAEAKR